MESYSRYLILGPVTQRKVSEIHHCWVCVSNYFFFIAESYSLLGAYHKWYIILLIGIQVVSRFLLLKTKLLRKLKVSLCVCFLID